MKGLLRQGLCLILAISMITPVAASAATLLDPYPSVKFTLSNGVTTNEMAYVDRFFDNYGNTNTTSEGKALNKWLNMSLHDGDKPDAWIYDEKYTNSGYLMLEREIDYQANDVHYIHLDNAISIVQTNLDTFGSLGANIVIGGIEELGYKKKFPNAGKDAYLYYTYLYQLYYEYLDSLDNAMQEVDSALKEVDTLSKSIVNTTKFVDKPNSITLKSGKSGEIKEYTLLKIYEQPGKIEYEVQFSSGSKHRFTAEEFYKQMQGNGTNYTLLLSENATNKSMDDLAELVNNDFSRVLNKRTNPQANLRVAPEWAETAQQIGDAMEIVSTATNFIAIFEEMGNVEDRIMRYLDALTDVTQTYLDNLSQWKNTVMSSSVPDSARNNAKESIIDALNAMYIDALMMYNGATNEIKEQYVKGYSHAFIGKQVMESALSTSGTLASIGGLADFAHKMLDLKKKGVDVSEIGKNISACAIGSMVLNAATAQFTSFGESSSTIYQLKWSLYEYLTGDNGLLKQYAKNRNHSTACQIIDALNMMKSAKYVGEDLVKDYYLRNFYNDENTRWNSGGHTVMENELRNWDSFTPIDISDSILDIQVLWRWGEIENQPHSSTQTLEIMGCFLADDSEPVSYLGEPLPQYPEEKLDFWDTYKILHVVDKEFEPIIDRNPGTSKNEIKIAIKANDDWLERRTLRIQAREDMIYNVGNEVTYFRDTMKLYSNNGVQALLSNSDYEQCLELQEEFNKLLYDYRLGAFDVDSKKGQYAERIEQFATARKWIESLEMYAPNVNYIQ